MLAERIERLDQQLNFILGGVGLVVLWMTSMMAMSDCQHPVDLEHDTDTVVRPPPETTPKEAWEDLNQ